jgi:hypothetical protein
MATTRKIPRCFDQRAPKGGNLSDEMNQKLTQAVIAGELEEDEKLSKETKFIEEISKRCTFV